MSAVHLFGSQPWVDRLGWVLIHFLWQGTLIALVYAATRRALRTAASNTRYLLACAALSAMAAAPIVTWTVQRNPAPLLAAAVRTNGPVRVTPPGDSARLLRYAPAASAASPVRILPWLVLAWVIGATACWIRLLGGWMLATRMPSRSAPAEWQQVLTRLAARIGVSRAVQLRVSATAQTPIVAGWLRPMVLAPVGALSGMAPEYLEALLLHELAHIRRHDYLVNLLQSTVEALLFYHPAIWWLSHQLRIEREQCCDDLAVSVTGDVFTYASALIELESCRPVHPQVALAASGGSLPERIAHLLGQSLPEPRTGPGAAALLSTILLALAAYAAFAQTTRPSFDAASIKPNRTETRRVMLIRPQPGGRLSAENAPLRLLIQNAYSLQAFQIAGGPAWMDSDGYDLEAKPAGPVNREQMWLMLQSLLAERFKLAVHRETRELPVYELAAAKGGLKLPPPKEGSCLTLTSDGPPPLPGSNPLCGRIIISMTPSGLSFNGGKILMPELTRILGVITARTVLDKTGQAAEFDIHITGFTPDEMTMGLPGAGGPGDPGGPPLPVDPNRPNLSAALQEQAGLKLSSSKGPAEVLVIDHVERPTAN
jgi:uncharacterized protein (TIGR03435 family)